MIQRPLAALLFWAAACAAAAGEVVPWDADWRFALGDPAGAATPQLADRNWTVVSLPHDWMIAETPTPQASTGEGGGYYPAGTGWYRKILAAPAAWAGRRVTIEFDGVYLGSEVWINGRRLGFHPNGYTPFEYDLSSDLRWGQPNLIAVRVDCSRQPNSRWYSGAGIYRPVRLRIADPAGLDANSLLVRTDRIEAGRAWLHAGAAVRGDNPSTVEVELFDPAGHSVFRGDLPVDQGTGELRGTDGASVAGGASGGKAHLGASADRGMDFELSHPSIWDPEHPALYRAAFRVRAAGRLIDQTEINFGVRTVRVSAKRGLELNGVPVKLVGGSAHHDLGPLGAAAFDAAEQRKVRLLKSAGFNAVRTAHNPPSPAFLEACDRQGLLVMDEAFDCWEKPKLAEDYHRYFLEWWQRDLDAMIRRDRNHPSVVMWSIGNEIPERATPEGARLARELTDRIRAWDRTRPITAGMNDAGNGHWDQLDPVFSSLDVAGYNYLLERAPADHARLPDRVIVATESYQSAAFAQWALVQAHPYVIGDFVWSAMDYLGEAGIGRVFPPGETATKHWEGMQFPWHGAYCGDIDLTGWRKPASHYRQIVWDRGERLYLAVQVPTASGQPWVTSPWSMPPTLPSWTWPGSERKTLRVEVYSRYPQVRLSLNGRTLGEKAAGQAEEFRADFTVPFEAGTLAVEGLENGLVKERRELKTAGPAERIRLTADSGGFRQAGDLTFVTAEVTDRAGGWRSDFAEQVHFTVKGPAEIIGLANGDMTDLETYQANPHRAFQGRVLVVLRRTQANGSVSLEAAAAELAEATLRLKA